jgi:hypothetical protein
MNFFKNTIYLVAVLLIVNSGGISGTAHAEEGDGGPSIHVGGAVRYNLLFQGYESDFDPNSMMFTMDTWRVNFVVDNPGGIGLNFEYRFYPTFGTHFIKQGWLQYDFSKATQLQLGVTQVPFGNLQYNSNNWWFQLPYYVGLEDDHDMGVKVTHTTGSMQWDFAYFFQPEPEGPPASFGVGGSGRYSYDVVPEEGINLTERNQFNIRGAYRTESAEFGASLQYGQLYNTVRDEFKRRYAAAVHANLNAGRWNFKPQLIYYNMDAVNDAGEEVSTVYMGAYGIPYEVATEAVIASFGVAYSHDVNWGPITNLTFYNDFSYMDKLVGEGYTFEGTTLADDFEATIHNITGVLISAGNVFTYVDLAQGINQPWLTDHFGVGLGPGHGDFEGLGHADAEYNFRFNVNIGFYF